ncbi:hypothetical protein VTH06DRAFT_4057 [Thermothelomyces fergusii]
MGFYCSAESSELDEPTPHDPPSPDRQQPSSPAFHDGLRAWVTGNSILLLSWFLTLTVGVPLRYCRGNDVALGTLLIFSSWLTALATQAAIKCTHRLSPHLRTLLSSLLNPVLCTSLAVIAYLLIDGTLSHRPLSVMLDTLQTHTTLSTLLLRPAGTPPTAAPQPARSPPGRMAAGDVATTLLNSGLVAWGLKLYAHRACLFSRAGLAAVTVSSALALANFVGGPLLARAVLGVAPPSEALAFAARSVTIALADPVMDMLGGDGGLNAAMVVGSGIMYQIGLGLGVGRWLDALVVERVLGKRGTRRCWPWLLRMGRDDGDGEDEGYGSNHSCLSGSTATESRDCGREEEGGGTRTGAGGGTRWMGDERAQGAAQETANGQQRTNDPRIVAAGVTIGVNAAAMGTAYLYEVHSEAAPHAALSMIALGVMTVVFSSMPPLSQWVVRRVGL